MCAQGPGTQTPQTIGANTARVDVYETTSALDSDSSLDGHGAAAHITWLSHRSVATLSALGQTLYFYGKWFP